MKNTLIYPILAVCLLAACKKNQSSLPTDPARSSISTAILGRWHIDTVTTFFYDTKGVPVQAARADPFTDPSYYFQFNNDNTWINPGTLDPSLPINISGTYSVSSESTFTLNDIHSTVINKECKVLTLNSNLFIFSTNIPTVYGGIGPGILKYVYRLTK